MKHIWLKNDKKKFFEPIEKLEKSLQSIRRPKKTRFYPNDLTATEEIFIEEEKQFYEKISSASNSPKFKSWLMAESQAPLIGGVKYLANIDKSSLPSPEGRKNLKKMLFPSIFSRNCCNTSLIPEKTQSVGRYKSRKPSIQKIMKVYEDGVLKTQNSKSLKSNLNKNKELAKEFTKQLDWASEKLSELNGYNKELMKKIYSEFKDSKEHFEQEKVQAFNDYKSYFNETSKSRVKNIKKLLSRFNERILY